MTGLLGQVDLPAPVGDRWFEDYVPGSVDEFGHASLSETEIVEFAWHYDPRSPGRCDVGRAGLGRADGLRLVAENPDRFARVVGANTGLPTGTTR